MSLTVSFKVGDTEWKVDETLSGSQTRLAAFDAACSELRCMLSGLDLNEHNAGDGASEFEGEHIHFLTEKFKDWSKVLDYLLLEKNYKFR